MNLRQITVLGATGSIGTSTLDVIARHPQRYQVFALSAHQRIEEMAALCGRFSPRYAVMGSAEAAALLKDKLISEGSQTEVLYGEQALIDIATDPEVDDVMAAIVGAAGLGSAIAAARAGKRLLLANKESLVVAGSLFMQAVSEGGATLLPIDSEHNAIFQCMPEGRDGLFTEKGVNKILLTASGGPFRIRSLASFVDITPEEAVAHPNWSMGQKISVDSATMMNKGLEVIEAHWLFGASAEQIQVVIHPESVIHSMVQYVDGSVLAQLGNPDMRTPIAHALAWPERIESGVTDLDIFSVAQLNFESADFNRFPCLRLAYETLASDGTIATVMNAANEIAVDAFLTKKIGFPQIAVVVEKAMQHFGSEGVESLEQLQEIDRLSRLYAEQSLKIRS